MTEGWEWCTAQPDTSDVAMRMAVEVNPANLPPNAVGARMNADGTVTISQPLTGIADKFWRVGSVLEVAFTNGTEQQRERVLRVAAVWSDHANVQFVEIANRATPAPDIRIGFNQTRNNSNIGTDSRVATSGGLDELSMRFTSTDPMEGTILHEFGHALGLKHEHQNPAAGIDWNKEAVYADLGGPTINWTRQDVDHNVFNALTDASVNYSRFDPESIMGYTIPASWTNDGFSTTRPAALSAFDISGISDWYPFGGSQRATRRPAAHTVTVLTRGVSRRMFQRSWDGARWAPVGDWEPALEGRITGHPGVAAFHSRNRLTVVARSKGDGQPVAVDFDGQRWGRWQELGGEITGSPLALRTDDTDWCFVRGVSGRPFFKQRTGAGWDPTRAGWQNLGGAITGSIAGAHLGDQVAIAARGAATSQAAIKWWDGSAWQPGATRWIGLGQTITAQPAIAWFGSDLHVCARFPDGTPHHLIYSPAAGAITQAWQPIQGSIIGSPTLVAGQDNTLRLLVRGTSRRIFLRTFQGGAWSEDWENLGGQAIDSPTALALPRTAERGAELHVFVTGLSRSGFRKVWDGTRWSPSGTGWENLGGHLDWAL